MIPRAARRTGDGTIKHRFLLFKHWFSAFHEFLVCLGKYVSKKLYSGFVGFEFAKSFLVDGLYHQRGKRTGIFIHGATATLIFLGMTLGPSLITSAAKEKVKFLGSLLDQSDQRVLLAASDTGTGGQSVESQVLGDSTSLDAYVITNESDKPRAGIVDYTVKSGDTLKSISDTFGVSMDTIRWANDTITSVNSIKPGQVLHIPPVTGVVVKVTSGDTIYSIAKKYNADAQSIVDYPFNTFTNDESFALAIGQSVVVPDGEMPSEKLWSPTPTYRTLTPNAGTVTATGVWIWPTQGTITQPWRPWHKAIDIANHNGGPILAADAGTVIKASWDNTGYGNCVVVDHGNGVHTLYGHLSSFSVVIGQTVKRGDKLGMMGSTGHSTGTHLHFEMRMAGRGQVDPLQYLK